MQEKLENNNVQCLAIQFDPHEMRGIAKAHRRTAIKFAKFFVRAKMQ